MSSNPLFPQNQEQSDTDNPAVNLIRSKVSRAYGTEPDATAELAEVASLKQTSKHQHYMQELSSKGLSLAEIQTAWHHYYTTLPDSEKHEVWQEFYAANQHTPYQKLFQQQQPLALRKQPVESIANQSAMSAAVTQTPSGATVSDHQAAPLTKRSNQKPDTKAVQLLKQQIARRVSANGQLKLKHHLQSLAFGLATGFVVLVLFLFTFFNEYIIAPFIQPSRTVSATPIILGDNSSNANLPPSVTVPKINIQIPIDFNLQTTNETAIENSLENGVIHYSSTVLPGQNGNVALFGHSSGNIFNNGKYKFAFTLLHDLTNGDLFYVNYNGKTYAYRMFDREIVPPSDVGVINDTRGKQATAELITCDPPGISTNRLVVWGEQISPAPSTNTTPAVQAQTVAAPAEIAGNGPTLWSRLIGKLEFWR